MSYKQRQRKCHHDTQSFWWWCQTLTKSLSHSKTNENGFGAGNRNSSHRSPNPKILYHIFQPHERLFLQTWWAQISTTRSTLCHKMATDAQQSRETMDKMRRKEKTWASSRSRRPQVNTGERRNRWKGHWPQATRAHVTPPHMPTKNKTYLNQKIIVLMWKNILQLFQLQHIHPQLPLEKYVEADAGK